MKAYKVIKNGTEKIKLANKPLGGADVYYASKLSNQVQYFNTTPQYTIVGTPSIENGIVSDFSNTSYLLLDSFADDGSDISMKMSFILPEGYPDYARPLNTFGNSGNNTSFFRVLAYKGGIEFRIKSGESLSISNSLSINTIYSALIDRTSNIYTLYLLDKDDNQIGVTTLQTNTLIANGDNSQMKIGYENRVVGAAFPGKINLLNTFIIKNNKVLFRGNFPYLQ